MQEIIILVAIAVLIANIGRLLRLSGRSAVMRLGRAMGAEKHQRHPRE
jgi:hypothetical protein